MYNGIGLPTARGSGTNGYVQKNLSSLKSGYRTEGRNEPPLKEPVLRKPDKGILEHERKRAVEIECMKLREELDIKGTPEDEIDERINRLRRKLLQASSKR